MVQSCENHTFQRRESKKNNHILHFLILLYSLRHADCFLVVWTFI